MSEHNGLLRSAETWLTEAQNLLNLSVAEVGSENSPAQALLIDLKSQYEANILSLPTFEQRKRAELLGQIEQNLQSKMPSTSKFAFRKAKPEASTTTASDSSLLASKQVEGQGAPLPRDSYGIKLHKVLGRDLSGSSQSASFTDLRCCIVDLSRCSPSALYLLRLESCIILAPQVAGSVLIYNADRCMFLLGCNQLRIHDSEASEFVLSSEVVPVCENCEGVEVGYAQRNSLNGLVHSFNAPTSQQSASMTMTNTRLTVLQRHLAELQISPITAETVRQHLQTFGLESEAE